MFTKHEEITPEKAMKYLEGNTHNRPVHPSTVEKYKRAMEQGQWRLTHQGIAFAEDGYDQNGRHVAKGTLLDGQHRLWAIVESGVTVPMMVTWAVDPETYTVIDVGARRTGGDTLFVLGEKSSGKLSQALSWLWRDKNGYLESNVSEGRAHLPTNDELLDLLRENPGIRNSLRINAMLSPQKMIPRGIAVWFHYRISQIDPVKAESFFLGVGKGEGLIGGDPRYALRDRLLVNAANTNAKFHSPVVVALLTKGWNAYLAGREMRQLKWSQGEQFPTIEVGPVKPPRRKKAS